MYCPDTLKRLNQEAVNNYYADQEIQNVLREKAVERDDFTTCDYCDQPSTKVLPVYNPADAVRDIEGAYSVIHICDECEKNGSYMDDLFYCSDCGSHHKSFLG